MSNKQSPIVGITCIQVRTKDRHTPPRLGQNRSYIEAISRAGAAPVLIPHLGNQSLLRTLYRQLDGLLLPGGEDIAPSHYGETATEKLGPVDADRDKTEFTLVRWAMDDNLPFLAICRGLQVLNVALGGSLYQDIQAQIPGAEKHDSPPGQRRDYLAHPVSISPQSQLARILGATSLLTNSLHHQSLKEIAPGLSVVGRAPDQVVEAVEASEHPFAVGVQWHPEELVGNGDHAQKLFAAFVQACKR